MTGLHAWLERYFPCPYDRGGSLLVIVGVFSALLYVYTKIGFKDELKDLPQNLMVLTFLISAWGQRQKLKSDLIFKLFVLAMVIPWLLFGINALIDYETAIRYRSTNDLLKLFLFLPLAWWIGGSREGAIRMLALAFLGLMTAVALDPDLMQSLSMLWARQRVDFGIYNAQHGGMFFALVILFCACSLGQRLQHKLALNWVSALLVFIGLVGLVALLGTKTRAAILGLFVAAFVALLLRIRQGNLFQRYHLSTMKAVLVSVLVAGLLSWPATTLYERLAGEKTTIYAVLTGNLDEVPFVSSGIRIHSWIEALHWIAEKPVTGWGQKARTDVIQLSERFPEEIKNAGFGHLHNGYLEILLGFGVVGLVFVCILWIVLLRRIRLAASDDLYAFVFYSSILFLVMNLFESFFIYSSGEFAMAIFMAAGYCQYLAKRLDNGAGAEHHPGQERVNTSKRVIDSSH